MSRLFATLRRFIASRLVGWASSIWPLCTKRDEEVLATFINLIWVADVADFHAKRERSKGA